MEDRRRIVSILDLQLDWDRKPTLLTQDLFDTVLDKDRKLFMQTAFYGIAGRSRGSKILWASESFQEALKILLGLKHVRNARKYRKFFAGTESLFVVIFIKVKGYLNLRHEPKKSDFVKTALLFDIWKKQFTSKRVKGTDETFPDMLTWILCSWLPWERFWLLW